jgi:protein-S-isoprenylcysteine O-methyltransferase Ste14
MNTLHTAIAIAWLIFWVYWFASAVGVKEGRASRRRVPLNGVTIVAVLLLLRVLHGGNFAVDSAPLEAIGVVLFASGIALAVWARVHLGRNWGMPMTQKAEPELITSGPYRLVRHPIYSGILLGLLGTALATNLYWLIIAGVMGAYFLYSAKVEERLLTAAFPSVYPSYRARTKMLIPFVL